MTTSTNRAADVRGVVVVTNIMTMVMPTMSAVVVELDMVVDLVMAQEVTMVMTTTALVRCLAGRLVGWSAG